MTGGLRQPSKASSPSTKGKLVKIWYSTNMGMTKRLQRKKARSTFLLMNHKKNIRKQATLNWSSLWRLKLRPSALIVVLEFECKRTLSHSTTRNSGFHMYSSNKCYLRILRGWTGAFRCSKSFIILGRRYTAQETLPLNMRRIILQQMRRQIS